MAKNTSVSPILRSIPVALGLLGLATGITMAALNGAFLSGHYGILGLSLVSIAGGMMWLNDVRWKETILSYVYTIFVLLCISLVYLISANRRERLDLTSDNLHTITPQTSAVLNSIPADQRVVANVFAPTSEHDLMRRFLGAYKRETPQFDFRLYDAGRDLDIVQQFGGFVDEKSVYIVVEDLAGVPIRKAPPENISLSNMQRESLMTNAIARTITEPDKRYYYILGHGERRVDETPDSLSTMVKLINDSSLPVEALRLSEGLIPENTSALIMAGPTTDIQDFEKELLIDYLENGGKMMIMIDPDYGKGTYLPNIQEVLGTVGFRIPNYFVVDPQAMNSQGTSYTPLAIFAEHPIAKGTNRTEFYMINARPVENTHDEVKGVDLKAIMFAGEKSWIEPAANLRSVNRLTPPTNGEDIGVQILAATAHKSTDGGRFGDSMRMVVVGDTDAFTDQVVMRNGDAGLLAVQSMNWLRERTDLLVIPPKLLTSTPVVLTSQKVWTILAIFTFIGLFITVGGTARALIRRRTR